MRSGVILALLFWLHPAPALASETLTGRVVAIADGDTLTLLVNEHDQVKVRLNAIDAPEKAQPFGQRSKQALSALCFGEDASIEVKSLDRYGRAVADVSCAGVAVNAELVRSGYAWVYRKYAAKGSALYGLEDEARAAARGLWADADPLPPWEWRAARRAPASP